MDGWRQEIISLLMLDKEMIGAVLFSFTIVEALFVHPLEAVTVTVYVPELATVLDASVPPPDHRYVPSP